MDILDDMGVSKLSAFFFFFSKVNYSCKTTPLKCAYVISLVSQKKRNFFFGILKILHKKT